MRTRSRTIAVLMALGGTVGCGELLLPAPADEDPSTSTGDAPALPDAGSPPPSRRPTVDDGEPPDPPEPPSVLLDVGSAPPPPEHPPPTQRFVDVTHEAGLHGLDPGAFQIPPFCLLSTIHDPPGDHDYCIPERFLGAAAVGDYDGDGWPDVYLGRMDGPGHLMHNRGDGTFEDVAIEAGLHSPAPAGGAAWLDTEGDGDLDLLLTSFGGTRHHLYVNLGDGTFHEQARERGAAIESPHVHVGMGIAVGDYDLDGWVDVFVADWRNELLLGPAPGLNRLLHNRGGVAAGNFEDVTDAMGIDLKAVTAGIAITPGAFGFAPAFVDLDDDGWPELTLVADFGTSRLFWNDGPAGLHDGTEAAGVGTETNGMGSAFGDLDGDGDLDWFVSSIWNPGTEDDGNRLYRNVGARSFADATDAFGVREGGWGWTATAFDVDLDGDLDLALAAGWPSMQFVGDPLRLWINGGINPESPWTEESSLRGLDYPGQGRGLVAFDYDRDGDLDLLVAGNTEPPALYRNDVDEGAAWLEVQVRGAGGNSQGLGARIRVWTEPSAPWQVRIIGVGGHLFGQGEAIAHFGLGDVRAPLHRVEVHWPASGQTAILYDVRPNQRLEIFE
ncbi:CRTAC1 family protein [Paraliomyxa miuraensis]|uniref:CRTAC1 family protein n=1 Tax=Paraliomyxa miuraensis TaxID=376150 RepID=UPI00225BA277|nr:CRTAC1 family protein [Paraliomyxa miuraensis]MCX4241321.1 CRTAC1 family protein [Paraliomyxa miuraensis]